MEYYPERWVMLKMGVGDEVTYKILAAWHGGLYGSSWMLNSGCIHVEENGEDWLFTGVSGTVYRCHKKTYGLTSYTASILAGYQKDIAQHAECYIDVMPEETNFNEVVGWK